MRTGYYIVYACSAYGLPFVELDDKNYGKRKRGTLQLEKGLISDD